MNIKIKSVSLLVASGLALAMSGCSSGSDPIRSSAQVQVSSAKTGRVLASGEPYAISNSADSTILEVASINHLDGNAVTVKYNVLVNGAESSLVHVSCQATSCNLIQKTMILEGDAKGRLTISGLSKLPENAKITLDIKSTNGAFGDASSNHYTYEFDRSALSFKLASPSDILGAGMTENYQIAPSSSDLYIKTVDVSDQEGKVNLVSQNANQCKENLLVKPQSGCQVTLSAGDGLDNSDVISLTVTASDVDGNTAQSPIKLTPDRPELSILTSEGSALLTKDNLSRVPDINSQDLLRVLGNDSNTYFFLPNDDSVRSFEIKNTSSHTPVKLLHLDAGTSPLQRHEDGATCKNGNILQPGQGCIIKTYVPDDAAYTLSATQAFVKGSNADQQNIQVQVMPNTEDLSSMLPTSYSVFASSAPLADGMDPLLARLKFATKNTSSEYLDKLNFIGLDRQNGFNVDDSTETTPGAICSIINGTIPTGQNCKFTYNYTPSIVTDPTTAHYKAMYYGANGQATETIVQTELFPMLYAVPQNVSSRLSSNTITALASDGAHVVYVATDSGLSVLNDQDKTFKNFTTANGLTDNVISDLAFDASYQKLFIAHGQNGIDLFDPTGNKIQQVSKIYARNIAVNDGYIYILGNQSTHEQGSNTQLIRAKITQNGGLQDVDYCTFVDGTVINGMSVSTEGSVYLASQNQGVFVIKPSLSNGECNIEENYTKDNAALASDVTNSVAVDKAGDILVATNAGVSRYMKKSQEDKVVFESVPAFADDAVSKVYTNGIKAYAAGSKGLYGADTVGDDFTQLSTHEGLSKVTVLQNSIYYAGNHQGLYDQISNNSQSEKLSAADTLSGDAILMFNTNEGKLAVLKSDLRPTPAGNKIYSSLNISNNGGLSFEQVIPMDEGFSATRAIDLGDNYAISGTVHDPKGDDEYTYIYQKTDGKFVQRILEKMNTVISDIATDTKGNLYIGSYAGPYIEVYQNHSGTYTDLASINLDHPSRLIKGNKDQLFVGLGGAYGRVDVYSASSGYVKEYSLTFEGANGADYVVQLMITDNDVYALMGNGDLYHVSDYKTQHNGQKVASSIKSIALSSDQSVLYALAADNTIKITSLDNGDVKSSSSMGYFNKILSDENNNLYLYSSSSPVIFKYGVTI